MARQLDSHLNKQEQADKREEAVQKRAQDMFMALPDFYTSTDGVKRYTNMEDTLNEVNREECIAIARALRDGDDTEAGRLLRIALMRVCLNNADYEVE